MFLDSVQIMFFVFCLLFAGEAGRPVWDTRSAHPETRLGRKEGRSIFQISEGEVLQLCAKLCATVMCQGYVPKLCANELFLKQFAFETN